MSGNVRFDKSIKFYTEISVERALRKISSFWKVSLAEVFNYLPPLFKEHRKTGIIKFCYGQPGEVEMVLHYTTKDNGKFCNTVRLDANNGEKIQLF